MSGIGLMAVLASPALAFRPSGWVYFNWPWAFDAGSGDWHWFKSDDTQWVNGFTAGGWRKLPQSALAGGWSFYGFPYAYCPANGSWYYLNEPDTQWVANMRTGAWSLFGRSTAPAGMVLIPGGTNAGSDPDHGAYSLTVTSFYMDRYEVSKALWDEVKNWNGGNGYSYTNAGSGKATNHPVHSVNWYDVVKWCNARSQKEGRTPVYYTDAAMTQVYKTGQVSEPYVKSSATGYRLPTDVQWEYAARGGLIGKRFPWGDTITHSQANYYSWDSFSYDVSPTREYHPDSGASPQTMAVGTMAVGSFAPNGYGLYDIAGNVWEWCFDWHPSYEGSRRVVRGGCWINLADRCLVGNRDRDAPGVAYDSFGFRAVLPPGQQ